MFFLKNQNKLYMLNKKVKIKVNHNINYYYEHLDEYGRKIVKLCKPYYEYEKEIALSLQDYGCSALHIHGCILDITTYDHIYVNPFDKTITYYYAENTSKRYVFQNFYSLLTYKTELQPNGLAGLYRRMIDKKPNEILNINDNTEYKPTEDDGYYIYKLSNNMKLLQYTVLHGIILKWNDDLVGKDSKLESFNWGNLLTEK